MTTRAHKSPAVSISSSKNVAINAKLDDLESRLREKVNIATGFADEEVKARKLKEMFKFFDTNNVGNIDLPKFSAAMVKLNFVGVQREVESLFNRYDDDASGTIDYNEFAYHVFGLGSKPTLDVNSRNIIEKVKARIINQGGASGFHGVKRILDRMDTDGSRTLDRSELLEGLRAYGVNGISAADMDLLINYFDRDRSGRISVDEFIRGLQEGMSFERKQLCRQAFNLLDKTGDGVVAVDDILQNFDFSMHPSVSGGQLSPEQAAEEMLHSFEQGGERDGKVSWGEFLDYYKGISASIDDDVYFELMMRNAWHISGGEGNAANTANRRVLVIHNDGSQEVIEIENDFGVRKGDKQKMIELLRHQGVRDIADIKL